MTSFTQYILYIYILKLYIYRLPKAQVNRGQRIEESVPCPKSVDSSGVLLPSPESRHAPTCPDMSRQVPSQFDSASSSSSVDQGLATEAVPQWIVPGGAKSQHRKTRYHQCHKCIKMHQVQPGVSLKDLETS